MAKNRTMAIKHAKARKDACREGIRRALDDSIFDYPYKAKLHINHKSVFKSPAINKSRAEKLEHDYGIPFIEVHKSNPKIIKNTDGIPYNIEVARLMYKYQPEHCPEFANI